MSAEPLAIAIYLTVLIVLLALVILGHLSGVDWLVTVALVIFGVGFVLSLAFALLGLWLAAFGVIPWTQETTP